VAQQLGQHCQRLAREVLIDEWFRSGEGFGCTAGRLIILFSPG
jgi:hypothetical protein